MGKRQVFTQRPQVIALALACLTFVLLFFLPHWSWENGRFDSVVDGAIAVPILFTAAILLLSRDPEQSTSRLVGAFLVTGLLRFLDSAVDSENELVWFHRLCSLSMALAFFIEWLPRIGAKVKDGAVILALTGTLAGGIVSGFFPQLLPTASTDHFATRWLEISSFATAGIFFLAALIWWLRFGVRRLASPQLFICCLFLGLTSLAYSLFPIWSLQWWLFQAIELAINSYLAASFFLLRHNRHVLAGELAGARTELMENVLAFVSHDIRNPIGTIKMATELLLEEPGRNAGDRDLLQRIARNVQQVEGMTQSLLDAELLRRGGTLPLNFRRCDLNGEIRRMVEEKSLAEPERIRFTAAGGELRGEWAVDGLQRLLQNLVTNAVRYGTPDSPIILRLERRGDKVALSVHNHGPAIPVEKQATLFEAFRRGNDSRSVRGWGLGLALIRGIAKAHGGEVSVSSGPTEGTTFTVELPIVEPSES